MEENSNSEEKLHSAGAENNSNQKESTSKGNPDNTENQKGDSSDSGYNEKIEGDPTKIKVNLNVSENVSGLLAFFKRTVSFRDGVKKRETIQNIKRDIVFQGHNVWILVCSMVVASIGLNMDSPAVVIGAMLISPLMSPILGVGLGVATVDLKLIYASLKNFGVMIAISLLASYLYFLISPVDTPTNELLGRVKPNAFDVPIAFFGGLAGIIAASRGGTSNVVPGVAIATALMPPLCTTGYGLATGHWDYALGAFYLFLLNCLFICLSTILTLRYLKFPVREYVDQKVEKKAKLYMYIFLGVIVVPAVLLSVSAIKESKFNADVEAFIENVVKADPNIEINYRSTYDSEQSKLFIQVLNDEVLVTDAVQEQWRVQMEQYSLEDVKLAVKTNDIDKQIEAKLKDAKLFDNGSNEGYKIINKKESEISKLREELSEANEKAANALIEDQNVNDLKKYVRKEIKDDVTLFSNDKSVLIQLRNIQIDSVEQQRLETKIAAFMEGKKMTQERVFIIPAN